MGLRRSPSQSVISSSLKACIPFFSTEYPKSLIVDFSLKSQERLGRNAAQTSPGCHSTQEYDIHPSLLLLPLFTFLPSLKTVLLPAITPAGSCPHLTVLTTMEPRPILPSATDLERRRLESTMDQDLHSLSLASLITSSDSTIHLNSQSRSMSSISSVEYPRGLSGPHGTPRAASRNLSVGTGESPVSTAGHHVSAMTLADGVYERKGARGRERNGFGEEDDWDPERSLGRLVGELGRVMSDVSVNTQPSKYPACRTGRLESVVRADELHSQRISPRPTSPFSPPRSPRSPSPFASILGDNPNLSFTLNRNDPLPSPPASRSGSGSSGDYAATAKPVKAARPKQDTGSRFSSMARELGNELKARRVLGESTTHNAQQTPAPRRMKEKSRVRTLQDEGRRSSAPGRVEQSADVTGLTGLMETPAKGGEFGGLGKNGDVGGDSGGTVLKPERKGNN